MRFLFRVTRHSAFLSISINTPEGFSSSAHNLLETRQFRTSAQRVLSVVSRGDLGSDESDAPDR
jgi:hypothetical protein